MDAEVAQPFGWLAGLFGALAFLFVPRQLFHAHLACFDMPIVAMTLLTVYGFWLALAGRPVFVDSLLQEA